MIKIHILLASMLLIMTAQQGTSQSTAMDFTRTDCDGTEHNLFQELEAGNVVVLEYIMLGCPSCIVASERIGQLIEPFAASHPGRVRQYMFGYIKYYNCAQLKTWQADNNLSGTMFEDGSSQVGYYGGMGMPTIAIAAGNSHQIMFVKVGFQDSDTTAIKAAIAAGLQLNPQSIGDDLASAGVRISPTLFTDRFTVTLPAVSSGKVLVYDLSGREVASGDFESTAEIRLGGLNLRSGIYFVVLKTTEGILGSMKVVRQ